MTIMHEMVETLPVITDLEDIPDGQWAHWEDGKTLVRRTPGGTIIGITEFIYTWGVLRGVDKYGYSERWCYHSFGEALANAHVLGDDDEPTGFIRKV